MELGQHIKQYRNGLNLSQEGLAEKICVSRQTISNWENEKSYPDMISLMLLSEFFDVTLDSLVKGDVEEMKQVIDSSELPAFKKNGAVYTALLAAVIITPLPLVHFMNITGLLIWLWLCGMALCSAMRIESQKKKYDIQTYREIVAYMEGRGLNEIEKIRESGKRGYQKLLIPLAVGFFTIVINLVIAVVLRIGNIIG